MTFKVYEERLAEERDRYKLALEAIRDRCGAVCPEYEVCTHPWCAASYTAWALADEALTSGPQAPETEAQPESINRRQVGMPASPLEERRRKVRIAEVVCPRCHGEDLGPAVCQDCNDGGVWWHVVLESLSEGDG